MREMPLRFKMIIDAVTLAIEHRVHEAKMMLSPSTIRLNSVVVSSLVDLRNLMADLDTPATYPTVRSLVRMRSSWE
jgi:hypothetical protein